MRSAQMQRLRLLVWLDVRLTLQGHTPGVGCARPTVRLARSAPLTGESERCLAVLPTRRSSLARPCSRRWTRLQRGRSGCFSWDFLRIGARISSPTAVCQDFAEHAPPTSQDRGDTSDGPLERSNGRPIERIYRMVHKELDMTEAHLTALLTPCSSRALQPARPRDPRDSDVAGRGCGR